MSKKGQTASRQRNPNKTARVFLSYKRDKEGPHERRDSMKAMLESRNYEVMYDEKVFTAGDAWRPQIFESVAKCDCVVVLWYQPSDWILIEAAYAKFLNKPYVFVCYDKLKPPAPFDDLQAVFFPSEAEIAAGVDAMNKVYAKIDSAITGARVDVPDFSPQAFRAALLEELERAPNSPHRARFENMFNTALNWEDLGERQLKLVRELLATPLGEDPPATSYSHDGFQFRYDLGSYLGELKGIPEDQLVGFTSEITSPHGGRAFRAMQYLVTQGLFQESLPSGESGQKDLISHYYPYLVQPLSEGWWTQIEQFIEWFKRSAMPLPVGSKRKKADGELPHSEQGVRLPTYDEWTLLAGKPDYWRQRVNKCNLRTANNLSPAISAVGVFQDSKSELGCYDIIGNVWELVLSDPSANGPSHVVGWSCDDKPRVIHDWNELRRDLESAGTFKIGFRLVIA